MFKLTMKVIAIHSAALQALGFSKWTVRDYSPVHHALVFVAYRLAMKQQ